MGNITPAPLTVTGITAGNKVYNTTTVASLNAGNAALSGVISGDSVTLNKSGAAGFFASKDVATGITVTISGLSIGGAASRRLHPDAADSHRQHHPRRR